MSWFWHVLLPFILGFIMSAIAGSIVHAAETVPYILHMPQQHDVYGGIRNKDNQLCCNREDCKKIVKEDEVNIKPDGGYVIRSSGEFVTEGKVADSPDENWHICRDYVTAPGGYTPTGKVRCLMIPQGGY